MHAQLVLEIPPFVFILAAGLAYAVVLFARSSWREALLAAWATIMLSVLFLPGGQSLTASAQKAIVKTDRIMCVGEGIGRGIPWRPVGSVNSVSSCPTVRTKNAAPKGRPQTAGAIAIRRTF